MSVTKPQPYTPLEKSELNTVDKLMREHCPKLRTRVVSQLRQQEHYIQLQRLHVEKIHESISDRLRDLADSVEDLEQSEIDTAHG